MTGSQKSRTNVFFKQLDSYCQFYEVEYISSIFSICFIIHHQRIQNDTNMSREWLGKPGAVIPQAHIKINHHSRWFTARWKKRQFYRSHQLTGLDWQEDWIWSRATSWQIHTCASEYRIRSSLKSECDPCLDPCGAAVIRHPIW